MSYSRIELMRNDIKTALEIITIENGYRTTPRQIVSQFLNPLNVSQYPTLAVVIGDSAITSFSSQRSALSEDVTMHILLYVKSDASTDAGFSEASEALIQDVKRVIQTRMIANVNDSSNKYITSGPISTMRLPDMKNGVGVHRISFKVKVLYDPGTF